MRTTVLKRFPLNTPRSDVEQRMATDKFSLRIDELRPKEGWNSHPQIMVRDSCPPAERRTKTRIERCQMYEGVHDMFSLAQVWFYYDAADKLVDIDAGHVD
ncbi:MAG: hypothetical protein ACJ8NS_15075 [Chthoniobacterales bacterium]